MILGIPIMPLLRIPLFSARATFHVESMLLSGDLNIYKKYLNHIKLAHLVVIFIENIALKPELLPATFLRFMSVKCSHMVPLVLPLLW